MSALKEFLNVAVEAAYKARKIQKEGFGNNNLRIAFKGPKNLVTEVDQKCEEVIIRHIREKFPEHAILAEESGAQATSSPFRWIIDPLDGTTNYAHAYPPFCVSIALEKDGEIILGVVYDPILDELFRALKGGGAWMNEREIHVSKIETLERSLVAAGRLIKKDRDIPLLFDQFKKMSYQAQALRIDGSAALDMCHVAMGRFDGFWEFGLKPWDTAAGSLIVQEAGGSVTDFSGNPFNLNGSELLTSNGLIHQQLIDVLK